MSQVEIGLSGLLVGSTAAAEAFLVLPAYVEECIHQVRYEVCPALRAIRQAIEARSLATSREEAAEYFKLPLNVANIVLGQPVAPSPRQASRGPEAAVSKDTTSEPHVPQAAVFIGKGSPAAKKSAYAPKQSKLQTFVIQPAALIQPGTQTSVASAQSPIKLAPQARVSTPAPPLHKPTAQVSSPTLTSKTTTESSTFPIKPVSISSPEYEERDHIESEQVRSLKEKINYLYNNGVKEAVITALYQLPPQLVHAWGNWTQLTTSKADTNRQLARQALEMLNSGCSHREVMTALKIKSPLKLHCLLGRFEVPKAYSAQQKQNSIHYAKMLRNLKRASEELSIPQKRIQKWVGGDDLLSDEDFMESGKGLKEDSQRLQFLEQYYLNGKSLSAVGQLTGELDKFKAITWVKEFEEKHFAKRKRQKTGEEVEA
jgi:hypothetical protein